ncbi:uncharacterized protein [Antedon mediterranea]|uniref:uncharacterized protein n=1 Tax=Antedon mediterranea TaxID=105859 RepID=UPI003AF8D259
MDIVGCSSKKTMSLSIFLYLSTFLPLSLGQGICTPNPCLNGGSCRPASRKPYFCMCPPGVSGEKCEVGRRIFCNEQPCLNGGTCISINTDGYCDCKDNFWGSHCELVLESPDGYTVPTIISMATGLTIGVVSLCICIGYVNYKLCCEDTDKPRPAPTYPVVELNDEFTIMDA